MHNTRLPHGLIDLLFAPTQATSRRGFPALCIALRARLAHSAAALQTGDHTQYSTIDDRSLYSPLHARRQAKERTVSPFAHLPPRTSLTTIGERVTALKNAIETEAAAAETAFYSEEELISLYEDLLALPAVARAEDLPRETLEQCVPVVQSLASRLLEAHATGTEHIPEVELPSLSDRLRGLRQKESVSGPEPPTPRATSARDAVHNAGSQSMYLALISRIEELLIGMEALHAIPGASTALPVALMVEHEWTALLQYCLLQHDPVSAERVLGLIQQSGPEVPEDLLNRLLAYCADSADIEHADFVVKTYTGGSPTVEQRDLHIKTYVKATSPEEFPSTALEVLHRYEIRALPAPQRTYNRLIAHLFSNRSAISTAHAWDLFAHMRYVAHPDPDATMYATMIRACASSSLSATGEPERALDLFHEMTIDKRMDPTTDVYNAVILACARSGSQVYVHEAFRLAKQMLDAHRDAHGASPFAPDRRLYCALLEGSKRLGDLPRVRWILAEMVRDYRARSERGDPDAEETAVNEQVMCHVFHAYTAYKPPFRRGETMLLDESTPSPPSVQQDSDSSSQKSAANETPSSGDIAVQRRNFTFLPPQTHMDVVREADALFSRLIGRQEEGDGLGSGFEHVMLTSRLLNAYIGVYLKHASLEKSFDLFTSLYTRLGVPRNARSYVDMLERCAYAAKQDRKLAARYAKSIWEEWLPEETAWRTRREAPVAATMDARLVERTYAAMIRTLTLVGELDPALELVRQFTRCYPPPVVREPQPKPALFSSRTMLIGEQPLIHLKSRTEIPDDRVPPLLSFSEVEVLHHRLVALGRKNEIGYLTWVCKAYEGSLRMRRERSLGRRQPISVDKSIATHTDTSVGTSDADA